MGLNVAGVDMMRSARGPCGDGSQFLAGARRDREDHQRQYRPRDHRLSREECEAEPHAHTGQGMTPFQIGRHGVAPGSARDCGPSCQRLLKAHTSNAARACAAWRKDGARLLHFRRVHGDEIQGVEIIRRILVHPALQDMAGTLLAVPIVNSFGFLNHTRYMPDRRDLNRCFPGSDRGSLASLVADLFFREVVAAAATASICTRRPCTGPTCRRSGLRPAMRSSWIWPRPSPRR